MKGVQIMLLILVYVNGMVLRNVYVNMRDVLTWSKGNFHMMCIYEICSSLSLLQNNKTNHLVTVYILFSNSQSDGVCLKHGARSMRQICSIEGCTKFVQCKGVCWKHGGKPVVSPSPKKTPIARKSFDQDTLKKKISAETSTPIPPPIRKSSRKRSKTAQFEIVHEKRIRRKFTPLNEEANPIHLHIPFVGQEKHTAITINAHCVNSKYDVSSNPIALTGKYSQSQTMNFLSGFGRYIY